MYLENGCDELESLWEQQRQKDAQNLVLEKKLSHYRSWINTLQNKVSQQNPQTFKNAKRLYIGGFLPTTTEESLRAFLHTLMKQTGGCCNPGNPVLSVRIMKDRNFAFAEFRSIEETVNATALDGVCFEGNVGIRLKIRRPSNYDINAALLLGPLTADPTMNLSGLDICRSTVEDSPHKLFIGGLPYEYSEERVKDLIEHFADVKSFNLVMDRVTGKSKGYAFCELIDESKTDWIIQQLNARKLENKLLTVKRSIEGGKNTNSILLQSMMNPGLQTGSSSSFPSDFTSLPHHGRGTTSPDQLLISPPRPYTALGLTGSCENLIGSTPLDRGIQTDQLLTQLAVQGQRPSSVISQLCSLSNLGTEAFPNGASFPMDSDLLTSSLPGNCFLHDRTRTEPLGSLQGLENPSGASLW